MAKRTDAVPDSVVSHVGIAVTDLDAAIARYRLLLGRAPVHVTEVPDQQVRVALFAGDEGDEGHGAIELLSPMDDAGPVRRFLERRGEGLHHVCVYVDDIEAHLSRLKAEGIRLIDETPRVGASGHRIAFVHPSAAGGVLLELEERPTR